MGSVEKTQTKTCSLKTVKGETVALNIGNANMSVSVKVSSQCLSSRGRRASWSQLMGRRPHLHPVLLTHRVHGYFLLIQKGGSPRFHLALISLPFSDKYRICIANRTVNGLSQTHPHSHLILTIAYFAIFISSVISAFLASLICCLVCVLKQNLFFSFYLRVELCFD